MGLKDMLYVSNLQFVLISINHFKLMEENMKMIPCSLSLQPEILHVLNLIKKLVLWMLVWIIVNVTQMSNHLSAVCTIEQWKESMLFIKITENMLLIFVAIGFSAENIQQYHMDVTHIHIMVFNRV